MSTLAFRFLLVWVVQQIVSMQVLAQTEASPAATAMFEDSLRNLRQVSNTLSCSSSWLMTRQHALLHAQLCRVPL